MCIRDRMVSDLLQTRPRTIEDNGNRYKTQYLKAPTVLTLILMLWELTDCSLLCALWVLYKCFLGALWVFSDCWLTADWLLTGCLKIWARKVKIDCSRQVWTGRTNGDCYSLSSCWSQKDMTQRLKNVPFLPPPSWDIPINYLKSYNLKQTLISISYLY